MAHSGTCMKVSSLSLIFYGFSITFVDVDFFFNFLPGMSLAFKTCGLVSLLGCYSKKTEAG